MADPVTAAATIVTLVGALATVSQTCHNIWERYNHAHHHLISLDVECSALTTSLQAVKQIIISKSSEFQNMIRSQEDNTLFDDLTTTLNSCSIVINHLNEQISKLYHATDSKRWFTFSGRAKYVWNEDAIRTLLDRTRGLTGAVNLILNTLQTQSLVNVYNAVQQRHEVVQSVQQSARALQLEDDAKSTFFLPNGAEEEVQSSEDAHHLDILMKSPAYKKAFMKWLKEPSTKEEQTIDSDDNLPGSSIGSLSDSIPSDLDSVDMEGSIDDESLEHEAASPASRLSNERAMASLSLQGTAITNDAPAEPAAEPPAEPPASLAAVTSPSRADLTAQLVNETLGPRPAAAASSGSSQPGRWKQLLKKSTGKPSASEQSPADQGPSAAAVPTSSAPAAPSGQVPVPVATSRMQASPSNPESASPRAANSSSHRIAEILNSVSGSGGPWNGDAETLVGSDEVPPPAYSARVDSAAQGEEINNSAAVDAAPRFAPPQPVETKTEEAAPKSKWWHFGRNKNDGSDEKEVEKNAEKEARAKEAEKERISTLQKRLAEIDADLQVLREVQSLITDRLAAKKNWRAIVACKRKIRSYERELSGLNGGDVHREPLTQSALESGDGGEGPGAYNGGARDGTLSPSGSDAPSVSAESSSTSRSRRVAASRHGRYAAHRPSSTTSSTTRFGDMMRDANEAAPEQARNALSNAQLLIASSRSGSRLLQTYEEARRNGGVLPQGSESGDRRDGKPLSKHKARRAARRELANNILQNAQRR